jgi:hypothetical protein
MRTLSRFMPLDSRPYLDEIFFAGLLHDIGYMVLNHLDQELSDELHGRFAAGKDRISYEIEAELLEMNHCKLGAELAGYWSLPETIIAVIRYHHDPENEGATIGQPLVRLLNLAEKILPAFGTMQIYLVPLLNSGVLLKYLKHSRSLLFASCDIPSKAMPHRFFPPSARCQEIFPLNLSGSCPL